MIKVSLHCFESDPALPQRDGVNLAHAEINHLLGTEPHPGLEVSFHDFPQLLRDEAYAARALGGVDCVLCNVGPHAHYYHALRERLGLGFRIVRDIKTALWSGYLLQESLCAPYLRPGDSLLATSSYSRALTLRLFPHLRPEAIHLFEPVLAALPPDPAAAAERRTDGVVTLGHLGRLSEDKNFPQKVDLLVELNRREPGRYRLLAVGAVHSPSCDPEAVARRVRSETGRAGLFDYQPPVDHARVFALMRQLDCFLFFSTSNLEVLGRVLVEAGHARVPVLASNHAAAPELVPADSLLDVRYRTAAPFYSHFDAPLGEVDIAVAADRIRAGLLPQALPAPAMNRRESLFAAIGGEAPVVAAQPLAGAPERFIGSLRWEGLPRYASMVDAGAVVGELQDWFNVLNHKAGPGFAQRLGELERISRFPERTARFLASARRTRCDFTNLGGIDIELCNVAAYHPRFELHAH